MHTRLLLASALVFFSLSLPVVRAADNTETPLIVSSSQTWLDTGIDVAPGDSVLIAAEAKPGSDASCSPDGTQGTQAGEKAPLPLGSKGALIARSTDHGDAILIGKNGQLSVGVQGRLFL